MMRYYTQFLFVISYHFNSLTIFYSTSKLTRVTHLINKLKKPKLLYRLGYERSQNKFSLLQTTCH